MSAVTVGTLAGKGAWSAAPATPDVEQAHRRIILERVLVLARRLHAMPTEIRFEQDASDRILWLRFPTTLEAKRWADHAGGNAVVSVTFDQIGIWAEWTWETCIVQITAEETVTR